MIQLSSSDRQMIINLFIEQIIYSTRLKFNVTSIGYTYIGFIWVKNCRDSLLLLIWKLIKSTKRKTPTTQDQLLPAAFVFQHPLSQMPLLSIKSFQIRSDHTTSTQSTFQERIDPENVILYHLVRVLASIV